MRLKICNFLFKNIEFNDIRWIKQNQCKIDEILTIQKQRIQDDIQKNKKTNLRGGGTSETKFEEQVNDQQQQIVEEQVITRELDIFQYIQFYSQLILRISEKKIDEVEIKQVDKVLQLFHQNEANLYNLSNQKELNQRQILIIQKAIESICFLLRRIKKPKRLLSYNLLQCIQQLFMILYSQLRLHNSIKFNTKYFQQFKEDQKDQAYSKQKDLHEIYDYQYSLIQILVKYLEELDVKNQKQEQLIFQYKKFQEQNDMIFRLIENAKGCFDDSVNQSKIHQYDIYYFFQSLKLVIIRIIKFNQDVQIDQIINQLWNGYQFSIEKNKKMIVHLHFLEMLFNLITYDQGQQDQFIDQTRVYCNELQFKLLQLNIWEHYIKIQQDKLIKQFIKFSFIKIINTTDNEKLQLKKKITINFSQKKKDFQIVQANFKNLINEKDCQKNLNKLYTERLMEHKEEMLQNYKFQQQNDEQQQYFNQINIPLKVKKNDNIENDLFDEFDFNCNDQIQQKAEINNFLWNTTNINEYNFKKTLIFFMKFPGDNIWKKILKLAEFSFDKYERKSFYQDVIKGQENLVLLFDGYDELKQKYIDQKLNIISSNELFRPQLGKNVKVIYTSRIETLNYEEYTQQFLGNKEKTFTQVEIKFFEEPQINQYLEQYYIQGIRQKLYCNSDKFIQNSQKQNSIISINNFKEIWEIFLLEDIQKLLRYPEQNKTKQIISDELLSNLFYKLQTILDCEDKSFKDEQEEFRDDFKKIQSQSQIMKQITNNQIKDLIKTPQSFKIILSVLLGIDKLPINKKTRFRLRLQKLKT
ncbi:unnamed protein product [Paramecium sonneborni]|uniref:Uncharacterized protein n=1 Tax=Paramecium sonneborni TaxID=65129 RepID=A0A8S1RST6_9CILI|nr:unnamed protein product [Paramecium sonneborni]